MAISIKKIRDNIDSAASQLATVHTAGELSVETRDEIVSMLENIRKSSTIQYGPAAEPIRTLHNFSCTGGTLFAKCLASMPNTLMLNEIDLHSSMPSRGGTDKFTPTDTISLLRQGDANISHDLITKLFISDLRIICEEEWKIGRALILRDHSHSYFLNGKLNAKKPTMREELIDCFPTRSLVTVRHPVDSYLSMQKHGWHNLFSPNTFNEYCRRYLVFLKRYENVPVIKYEALVASPEKTMQQVCDALSLSYNDQFQDVFSIFKFSGDSGRGGNKIVQHERKTVDEAFRQTIKRSKHWLKLKGMLAYD